MTHPMIEEAARAMEDLETVAANSFRDFHALGLHYLCLKRSEELTLKVYFFEGDVSSAPEVVIPHDHRYDFDTSVLAGRVINRTYLQSRETERGARPFEEFDYLTPLNGGDGFTWRRSLWLREASSDTYERGQSYFRRAPFVHTIQIAAPDTILFLSQGKDEVRIGEPTSAFRPDGYRESPSMSGLYKPMPIDECASRLRALSEQIGEA